MARLAVPAPHRATLTDLANAEQSDIDELTRSLGRAPETPYVSRDLLIEWAQEALPDQDRLDPAFVVDVLLTMSSARTRVHPQSPEAFADHVSRASNLELDAAQRTVLAERLRALLGIDTLTRSAKVVDLADEHERIFHSARILTDVRPVFADDPTQSPEGAITFHVLKLESFIGGRVEDYFIALDDSDLNDLKFAVDRAIEKASTLSRYLDSTGLARFDTKDDGENSV